MLLEQLFIILIVILVSFGIWLYFFVKNKQIYQQHVQHVLKLSEKFAANKHQILKREKGLDGYNFVKYNLSEALIVQSEIII